LGIQAVFKKKSTAERLAVVATAVGKNHGSRVDKNGTDEEPHITPFYLSFPKL
jgi:hypothetical protein